MREKQCDEILLQIGRSTRLTHFSWVSLFLRAEPIESSLNQATRLQLIASQKKDPGHLKNANANALANANEYISSGDRPIQSQFANMGLKDGHWRCVGQPTLCRAGTLRPHGDRSGMRRDVPFGSLTDIGRHIRHVRFGLISGPIADVERGQRRAHKRLPAVLYATSASNARQK
jgi:hypothetical protein